MFELRSPVLGLKNRKPFPISAASGLRLGGKPNTSTRITCAIGIDLYAQDMTKPPAFVVTYLTFECQPLSEIK
jgi:hypothetical protein